MITTKTTETTLVTAKATTKNTTETAMCNSNDSYNKGNSYSENYNDIGFENDI